ncbi:hypothetical protein BY998_1222 [Methylobacterium sp. B4]|nr:hypothetical protein BY998_1222 [Methylobacterium sp. B4]
MKSESSHMLSRNFSRIDVAVISSLILVLAGVKAMILVKVIGVP